MARLVEVLNQAKYPGAGDVDDCWVVSPITCAHALRPKAAMPTIPSFRLAAGKPDVQGVSNGGTRADVLKGSLAKFPYLDIKLAPTDFAKFELQLRAGYIASIAVLSSKLPAILRFGFNGKHQISLEFADGKLLCANPLAPEGSKPIATTWAAIKAAAYAFNGDGKVWGVLFNTKPIVVPAPVPAPPAPDPELAALKSANTELIAQNDGLKAQIATLEARVVRLKDLAKQAEVI